MVSTKTHSPWVSGCREGHLFRKPRRRVDPHWSSTTPPPKMVFTLRWQCQAVDPRSGELTLVANLPTFTPASAGWLP
jgi:hypothetical protein